MKNALPGLLLIVATTVRAALPDPQPSLAQPLQASPQQRQTALLATMLLSHLHSLPLDHALSKRIFDHYLKALDADRLCFTKADLGIPFAIFNLYAQRVWDRYAYARELLKDGFDFAQKESFLYERNKKAWPDSRRELQDLWRKHVKNDWLQLLLSREKDEAIVETLDKRYQDAQKKIAHVGSEDVFEMFMNA